MVFRAYDPISSRAITSPALERDRIQIILESVCTVAPSAMLLRQVPLQDFLAGQADLTLFASGAALDSEMRMRCEAITPLAKEIRIWKVERANERIQAVPRFYGHVMLLPEMLRDRFACRLQRVLTARTDNRSLGRVKV